MEVKYPGVRVLLVGTDGNAFNVLGLVLAALKEIGAPPAERAAFLKEATAGDYDHLLRTAMQWVEVE